MYPQEMTSEDIELFELDMARMDNDPSFEYDQLNLELARCAVDREEGFV